MEERRRYERHSLWFPIRLGNGEEAAAVSYDASQASVMMVSSTPVRLGERLTVTFQVRPNDTQEYQVSGRVVRTGANDADPFGPLPYQLVIEFDQPIAELDAALRAATAELLASAKARNA